MNHNFDIQEHIGIRIKNRRKKKQLTLQDMAKQTGFSVGFLSQVERNISIPTLTSLAKIAEVLGVSLGYFITIPGQRQGVNFIKANDRTFYPYDNGESICKIHTDNDQQEVSGLMMKSPPGFQSEKNEHDSDEIVYCISGEMVYNVNGTIYHMHAGDVIYVPGNTPHQWSNPGDTESIVLWVAGITSQAVIPPS